MNEYFKSEAHKIGFALNYLDGVSRMKVLEIDYTTCSSKKKAIAWHDKMIGIIEGTEADTEYNRNKLKMLLVEMV